MKVNPNVISPSQDFLKPRTVAFIFECIKNGQEDKLPPTPIVRYDPDGELVAIDGHNLLAVKAFLDHEVEVHIAVDKHDGLQGSSDDVLQRNKDLQEKFESCLVDRDAAAEHGIISFRDLIDSNITLFTD